MTLVSFEHLCDGWICLLVIYVFGIMSRVVGWNIGFFILDTLPKHCCKKKIESI